MCVCIHDIRHCLHFSHHPNRAFSPFLHKHPPTNISTAKSSVNPAVRSPARCAIAHVHLNNPSPHSHLRIYMCLCSIWLHVSGICLLTQVGLHADHHLFIHRQPGCLPNGPEDGGADRVGGWSGRPDINRVWHNARRIHNDFFSGEGWHSACSCNQKFTLTQRIAERNSSDLQNVRHLKKQCWSSVEVELDLYFWFRNFILNFS